MIATDQIRRSLIFGGIGLLLGSCIKSPVIGNAYNVGKTTIFGHPNLPLKRNAITKLPYASMTARVGNGPQSLLLYARQMDEEQHWISGLDRSVLALREGRIVKTFGFPENLKETRYEGTDPVNRALHKLTGRVESTRYIDLDLSAYFNLAIESIFESLGPQKIRIVELDFDTILIREINSCNTLRFQFENLYWVDPEDGFVWKSRQVIARSFPPVHFEILKPPA